MTIDSAFWVAVSFFMFLAILIYFKIPQKVKNILDENILSIKNQINEAEKLKEYESILENSKKEVAKILLESKNTLNKDIQNKKDSMEKEIENEVSKAQKEIIEIKKSSISSINNISQEITSNIIERISGNKLNESSIKAVIEDISKKNIGKYL